jgi:hypothetical protein
MSHNKKSFALKLQFISKQAAVKNITGEKPELNARVVDIIN